jgi:dihydrofolate reductase
MSVIATITTSVDGYITGPDDRAGQGLGIGGERLHHWVMGGPWTYESGHDTRGATGADREHLDALTARMGAGICGRGMYEAAGRWGGTNPFGGPLFVVSHRTEDAPDPSTGFTFVSGVAEAIERAREVADGKDVSVSGGADVIRQALAAGLVDELALTTAPVVLGAGKRLFDGFEHDLDLRIIDVVRSDFAIHTRYEVVR